MGLGMLISWVIAPPMLEARGIPAEAIELMLQDNPARMLRLAR